MSERQSDDNGHGLATLSPERIMPGVGIEVLAAMDREERRATGGLTPRVYVASLSDYNAGTLHGSWIDADQETEAIWAEVQAMLASSPEPFAEEWAIHDYEDFGGLRLSEWESFDQVSRIGTGIAQYGKPFAHWATFCKNEGSIEDLEAFPERYHGVWESEASYGEAMMQEYGIEDEIEKVLRPHFSNYLSIDYAQFGRDCLSELWTATDEDGIHVFSME